MQQKIGNNIFINMKLKDVCVFSTEFPDADFWLIRQGDIEEVGKPTKEYNEDYIGVKVRRTDLVLPDYLYYVFMYLNSQKLLATLATGTTNKMSIRISDIKEIPIGQS